MFTNSNTFTPLNITEADNDPYPFEKFAPTLSQCFVIVIVGYLMAKFELLRSSDVKGVNAFAAYFAMPGIICVSLAEANFENFQWELLMGIFLGKFFIFFTVAGFLILLKGNVGVAGAVAIFCVQSNDLPVGNPLMSSLYKDYRPQMMKYLFLIPAMTVIFFVPIGNILISIYRTHRNNNKQSEASRSIGYSWKYIRDRKHLNHVYGLVKNPVVIATLLGLFLNFVFNGKAPAVLLQPIEVAAATIPGLALAILGFSFVRKERFLVSSAVVPAVGLLILKMVLTPILLHTILKILTVESNSSKLLSDFALLYGIISPATGIFHSGQEFRKPLAVMSVALILSSFSCFPVSYIVARFTIAPIQKISSYVPLLKDILFWTACGSIFSNVVVWISMVMKKQWRRVPCCYVMYLAFTQCLTSCGILFWSLTEHEARSIYFDTSFYYGGEISGYIWTGTLAFLMIFKERYSMMAEKRFCLLSFTAFGVSALITTVMCLLILQYNVQSVYVVGRTRSNFEFLQLIMTTILLFISLVVVSGCLIYHFKQRKDTTEFVDFQGYENSVFYIQEEDGDLEVPYKESFSLGKQQGKLEESGEAKFYCQDVLKNCKCNSNLSSGNREWTNQLINLMMMQGFVMFVRLISNLFKLMCSKALEIMIPLEFLQSILFIGQGIILLLIFGIDVRTITIRVRKWWRKTWLGADEIPSNFRNIDLNEEVAQFCTQFHNFYFHHCFQDIAKERRWKDTVYKDSFWGHQLVDWMISEGLCKDDTEAEELGEKLLTGGVCRHVADRHHFYDAPYLYYFVRKVPGNLPKSEKESCEV